MRAALAVLLVVAVAEFVECMPQLKESVQARLANLQTKRGKGKGKGEDKAENWPFAWIEFSQLIGKCEASRNTLEAFNITLSEEDKEYCVLAKACPSAIELGNAYLEATEEEQEHVAKFIKHLFPLIQCVNLEAVKESVLFSLWLNNATKEGNVYLEESASLFTGCERLFGHVESEIEEFNKDMEEAENLAGTKKRALQAKLERLLQLAARKGKY